MDDFSVGDFAERLVTQAKQKEVPLQEAPSSSFDGIEERPLDVSQVEIPQNFLEAIVNNKDYVEPLPVEEQPFINEDKAEVAEDNPLAGQAIDIIIEGLGKMLEAVQGTLNEVKEFVNEHSLVTEITAVGDLGVNMAPSNKKNKKKKPAFDAFVDAHEKDGYLGTKVEKCEYDDEEEKDDKVKRILNQFKNRKKKK